MVQAVVEAHATHNTFYSVWNEAKDRQSELTYPCVMWEGWTSRLIEDVDGFMHRTQLVRVLIITSVATDRTPEQRDAAVEAATLHASVVPLTVMKEAFKVFELLREMIANGNPNSVTDGAVGVLAVRACIRGAFLNVRINVKELKDRAKAAELVSEASEIDRAAASMEEEVIPRVIKELAIEGEILE